MTNSPPGRVRLDGPAALVAAVPHLLGFPPEQSLVAVGLAGRPRLVRVCMRADLPIPADADAVAQSFARQLAATGSIAAVLLVYPGRGASGRAAAAAAAAALRQRGMDVPDIMRVRGGRFRSYGCRDRRCCPPAGRPVPVVSGALAAAMVMAGRRVLAGRSELAETLAGAPAPELAFLSAARDLARRVEALGVSEAIAAVLREIDAAISAQPRGAPAAEALARWCVALTHATAWDACTRYLGTDRADEAEVLWLALVRAAAPPYVVAPACLLALHAYARGDGAFARVCLDHALAGEPRSSLARSLHALLDSAVPPEQVRSLLGLPGSGA